MVSLLVRVKRTVYLFLVVATLGACKHNAAGGAEVTSVGGRIGGGGMTGSGGGGGISTRANPWFPGQGKVYYCKTLAADFSAPPEAASQAIRAAIDDWLGMLKHAAVNPHVQLGGLTPVFEEVPCGPTAALTFLLGVTNDDVTTALGDDLAHTIGFTQQTSFDDATGRAKGFIWLAADNGPNAYTSPGLSLDGEFHNIESLLQPVAPNFWLRSKTLENVLIHELGHVFGVQHQPHGVMAADVPLRSVHDASTGAMTSAFYLFGTGATTNEYCGQVRAQSAAVTQELFGQDLLDHDDPHAIAQDLGGMWATKWTACYRYPTYDELSSGAADQQLRFYRASDRDLQTPLGAWNINVWFGAGAFTKDDFIAGVYKNTADGRQIKHPFLELKRDGVYGIAYKTAASHGPEADPSVAPADQYVAVVSQEDGALRVELVRQSAPKFGVYIMNIAIDEAAQVDASGRRLRSRP